MDRQGKGLEREIPFYRMGRKGFPRFPAHSAYPAPLWGSGKRRAARSLSAAGPGRSQGKRPFHASGQGSPPQALRDPSLRGSPAPPDGGRAQAVCGRQAGTCYPDPGSTPRRSLV